MRALSAVLRIPEWRVMSRKPTGESREKRRYRALANLYAAEIAHVPPPRAPCTECRCPLLWHAHDGDRRTECLQCDVDVCVEYRARTP